MRFKLKRRLLDLGLTQMDLCKISKLSASRISKISCELVTPTLAEQALIARILGTKREELWPNL